MSVALVTALRIIFLGFLHRVRQSLKGIEHWANTLLRSQKMAEVNLPDLVTWTLGNPSVSNDVVIFADPLSNACQITKKDIIALVRCVVAGLRYENGGAFLKGNTVCVHSFNSIFYPVLFQGIVGAGGRFTGTNPAYTESELHHHFRLAEVTYVITDRSNLDRVSAAAVRCNIPRARIFVFDVEDTYSFVQRKLRGNHSADSAYGSRANSPASKEQKDHVYHRSLLELLYRGQSDWLTLTNENSRSTGAALFSTSGTSGLPKIAMRTHANLITECMAIQDRHPKSYKPIRLLCVPLFHAFASPLGNIVAMREGITTYIMPRFAEEDFLNTVHRCAVTETALVPPIIVKWLANPSDRRQQQLCSVRTIWCGGAPLDGDVQARAVKSMLRDDGRIVQVWGLTECGWLSTFHYPEQDTTGSVGRPLPGYHIKIIDDSNEDVSIGRGELVAKSDAVMSCYLSDEKSTSQAFLQDGWYRTGDIGELRDGKIYIVDRKKELIKVRGWQVAPAELEAVLLHHEDIVDAAVIGVVANPDSVEEVPEAHVVCAAGITLTAPEVKSFLLQYLAKYKAVDCGVVFRESIPKSASGKILRKNLRAEKMNG